MWYGGSQCDTLSWDAGVPLFPYFQSPIDCRKVHQGEDSTIVAHQFDFCGGFHFLGPVSWHYKAGEGSWSKTEECLRDGMEEFKNLAEMSGHPAFGCPLYDGTMSEPNLPNEFFTEGFGEDKSLQLRFIDRYQRFFAFRLPREYKLVFANSLDIADYFCRHFKVTPRTIFVTKSDHIMYDTQWHGHWVNVQRTGKCNLTMLQRQRIPWYTRVSSVHAEREAQPHWWKDPISCEFILYEDQKRSIRFERECPNPIWRFDYTHQEVGPKGSSMSRTDTPDVFIKRSPWNREGNRLTQTLKMQTEESFADYGISLWGLPETFDPDAAIITNAKEQYLGKNKDGEYHLVLFFDLEPDLEISVSMCTKDDGRCEDGKHE